MLAGAAGAQVLTVDGDLSDWDALPPDQVGLGVDPCNELFNFCKSGFDFTRILVYYDQDTDTLFFGIDLMDVVDGDPTCRGLVGPGVAGDADGDLDPCVDGDLAECEINEDQFCVGPDEQYLFKVDTNFDGDFGDAVDLRVLYRGNSLRFEHGNGTPFTWPGDVVLGLKGAQTACDCPDSNPETEDIEIAVYNYSELDPVPVCLIVDAIAGSLVDLPPEDFLDEPILIALSAADISVDKKVRNVTQGGIFRDVGVAAAPGDTVEFQVTVCNTGNIFLDPVMLFDTLPAGLENPTIVSGPGCTFVGNALQCNLGRFEIGDCVTVLYRADVAAGASGILRNDARAQGQAPLEGSGATVCGGETPEDADYTRVVVLDLACEKGVSRDGSVFGPEIVASPGETVTFKVRVTNSSRVDLLSVAFEDILPGGYVEVASDDPRVDVSGNTVSSATLGPLAANGGFTEVLYRARVAPDAPETLLNTAHFVGAAPDGSEIATNCEALVRVEPPAIECEKLVSADGVNYAPTLGLATGQTAFFRLTIRNLGNVDFYTTSLLDILPAVFTDLVAPDGCLVDGNTIRCDDLGPLAAGGELVLGYSAHFIGTTGSHSNLALVTGTPGTSENPGIAAASECAATVDTLVPGIACVKEVSLDGAAYGESVQAALGQTVFFRVQVMNTGSAPLRGATIVDGVPAALDTIAIVQGACGVVGQVVTCETGPLGPAEGATVVFSARMAVDEGGPFLNVADVTGHSGTDENPGDDTATSCDASVLPVRSDIDCEKLASTDGIAYFPEVTVETGQTVFFRVIATNTGDSNLVEVTLDDLLPDGYDSVVVDSGTCSVAGRHVQCSVPSLGPGASVTFDYHAVVTAVNPPTESLVNTATVTGTPGSSQNPGDPVDTQCSATAILVTPSVVCDKTVSIDGESFFPSVEASKGQNVVFKVVVTNDSSGAVDFDEVEIVDALPTGFGNAVVLQGSCTASGTTVQCLELGPIPPGESVEVRYRAKLLVDTGTLVNTAQITARYPGGETATSCSAAVTAVPASILCSKTVSKDGTTFQASLGAVPGQTIWFRVAISNPGEADLFVHSLEDALPTGYEDLAIVQGPGCVVVAGNTVSCDDLGPLPSGGPETVVIYRARLAASAGVLMNTAQVSGRPGTETNPGALVESDCSATVEVRVPDVECEKGVSLQPDTGWGPSVTAARGMAVYFRVRVTNTGDGHFGEASLEDTLPAGLGNVVILQGNCTAAGNTVSCDLGPIPIGGEAIVIYAAEVLADGPTTLTNLAEIEAIPGLPPENPGDPVTTSCGAQVQVVPPEIACEKTATPDQASPGQTVTFEVTVRNDGEIGLVEVTLEDELDPSAFQDPAVLEGNCGVVGNRIECDLGSLAAGASITVRYTARLVLETGTAQNTARVEGKPGIDGNPGEPVTSECPAQVQVLEPSITCDKKVSTDGVLFTDSATAEPGDTIWFEVTIDNDGDACFHATGLEDILPDDYENPVIVEGPACIVESGNAIRCVDLGPLCPEATPIRVVYLATIRTEPPPSETIVNTAHVTGIPGTEENPGEPVASDCAATVETLSLAIECEKTAAPNPVVPGQVVTFEVVIRNLSGTETDFDRVSLTDTLPEGFAEIQVIEPAAGCPVDAETRTIQCDDLGPLPWNESLTVRYTAKVTATNPPTGSLTNTALVTGHVGEFETSSECSSTILLGIPAVSCVKLGTNAPGNVYGDPVSAIPGQRVFFEVRVSNDGDVPFFAGTLTDTLPAGFSEVQVEAGTCDVSASTVTCELGPMDPGAEVVLQFSGRLAADPPQPLVNRADVTVTPGTADNPGDPLLTSCEVPIVVLEPAVECVKLASTDGVAYAPDIDAVPGQTVFFRITVTNTGEARLFRITLTDVIPTAFFENFVVLDPGVCSLEGNVLTCVFGPLAPAGGSIDIHFAADVRSDAAGETENVASILAESGAVANPGVTVGTSCPAIVRVVQPSVTCAKQVSRDGVNFFVFLFVMPGEHLYFRVTVSNDGAAGLTNVSLQDLLPVGYVNVSTIEPTCAAAGQAVTCDLGALAPGEQRVIFYEADVAPDASGELVNTAVITAQTGGDPLQTSCSARASATVLEIPTLTEFGLVCLVLLLGASLILHRRRRV